jgi:DNA-binding NarL/FixJ family response regulator
LSKRILIADDHPSILRRVRAILESHPNWEVCGEALDGREAVTKAWELKPDLIVLDFAMPRLHGLKAASEIRTLLPKVPILMFTMYSSAISHEANANGISRVIDKAESGSLVNTVEELLGIETRQTSD